MKPLILFLIVLFSCKNNSPQGGTVDSSQLTVEDPEVTKLKLQVAILETKMRAREKFDSTINVKVNSEAAKLKDFKYTFSVDSVKQWIKINTLTQIPSQLLSFNSRFRTDSVNQWISINKHSVAITALQSASPVIQIPIMQNDIKNIQSKNLSQDKMLIAYSSAINNINDTLNVLKVDAGTDFAVDSNHIFQISQAGMKRIKAEIQQ